MTKIGFFYGDKRNNGEYDNGVWMDILGIPFLSRIDQAEDYDVIIRTLWVDAIGWSKEIRTRFPHVKQIGLSDHPLSTHISKLQPAQQLAYLKDLEYLDGLMALTEEERQFYQTALPAIPVIKAGLPFPFESYQERYGRFQESERKYIGLGVGAADNDRNFVSSFLVYQRLKMSYPDLPPGVFLSLPSYLIMPTNQYAEESDSIFMQERKGMEAFYDTLSQCKFVINMADRNTPGRLQGECAFFRIPCIGSERFELQEELFPQLAIKPYALQDAVALADRLLNSETLLSVYGDQAYYKLQKYNYRASKRKFNSLLRTIQERG